MTWTTLGYSIGYFVFFLVSAMALVWWQRRQKKRRFPFPDQLRLLRAPGESQLKIVLKSDEDFPMWVGLGAGLPALVMATMLGLIAKIPEVLRLPWLLLSLVVFIGSFLLAVRWFARKTEEMRNRYLGYFGERVVAEHLEPLKLQGWRVFHDVPCQHEGVKFNIDHIAVGAGGVFIIETKTRRKGSARPGFKDNVVSFDGQRLVWPWAEDNHGLEQAERNALWFAKIVKQETGEQVVVTPILVLPGWWVEMKPMRSARFCRVANPKWLPDILGRERPILSEVQVGAIAAKLEIRCRDVEY